MAADPQASAVEWLVNEYHRVGDACDAARMGEIYATDSITRFGNAEPLRGISAIIEHFAQQFTYIATMKHTPLHVDVVDDTIYQPADIVYTVVGDPDKVQVKLRGFAVIQRVPRGEPDEGKIRRAEFYFDPTPLAQRIGEVAATNR